jgi:hypothetical protein
MGEKRYTERCQGIVAAGRQCKCYATQKVNDIPLCDMHAAKELRAVAKNESAPLVEKRRD